MNETVLVGLKAVIVAVTVVVHGYLRYEMDIVSVIGAKSSFSMFLCSLF